jgi:hypothetical protein
MSIEQLRRGPIGALKDVLSRSDGRPWQDALPESIRGLLVAMLRVEMDNAKEGK